MARFLRGTTDCLLHIPDRGLTLSFVGARRTGLHKGGGGGGGLGGQPYPFERFHAVSIIGMKLTFFGQESHKGGQEYMNADDVIDFVHTS